MKVKGSFLGNLIFWAGYIFGFTSVVFLYLYDYENFTFTEGLDEK